MNAKELTEMFETMSAKIDELEARIVELETNKAEPSRDRGPKSEHSMTREHAWRVKFGDLKDKSHKAAALELGLSYGQVYSARGGYTFTDVKADEYKIEETA